ncbi:hypothetical protein [Fodinicola acaciae]|uniref:hypothetical protein n=1 Tax=Fodinicola acaciae TaxID=2681555 RepID=UPI0013D2316E|nr:hypothetical protein [Fodinicola acaciae]
MLDADLWKKVAAVDAGTQRRLVAELLRLVMDAAPVTTGRAQIEAALAAGSYGDEALRDWLSQSSTAATAASLDADELDGDQAEAKRIAQQARGYKAAYLALDTDPARAAGEVAYEAMALLGQDPITATTKAILDDPSR